MARMLKADFHAHTASDPFDSIPHDELELIDLAAAQGYDVLTITNHGQRFDPASLTERAAAKGIMLMTGIEAWIEGKHVVLLNCDQDAERLDSFADLRAYRASHPEIFVLAPHPFYPKASCLGDDFLMNLDLFDGVEFSHLYLRGFNRYNEQAAEEARRHGKTLLGTSDCHRLYQFGSTFTLVEAAKTPEAVIAALKAGKCQVVSRPVSLVKLFRLFLSLMAGGELIRLRRAVLGR